MDERTAFRRAKQQRDGKLKSATVAMAVADESGWPRQGRFDFADPTVDPATATVRCRAIFPNPDGLLMPGLSARVHLVAGEPHQALLVPERVIGREQGQPFVLVVTDRDLVEKRPVKVGAIHEGLRVVTAGLKAEDRVVVGQAGGAVPGKSVKPKLVEISADRPK